MMQGPGGMVSPPSTSVLMPTTQRSMTTLELRPILGDRPAAPRSRRQMMATEPDDDREDHRLSEEQQIEERRAHGLDDSHTIPPRRLPGWSYGGNADRRKWPAQDVCVRKRRTVKPRA